MERGRWALHFLCGAALLTSLLCIGQTGWICWRALARSAGPDWQPSALEVQPPRDAQDYARVVSRDLFRAPPESERSSRESRAGSAIAISDSSLRLLGTVFMGSSTQTSRAIVRESDSAEPRVVGVGERILDAQVIEIARASLLVQRSGRLERVAIELPTPGARRAGASLTAARERFSARYRAQRIRGPRGEPSGLPRAGAAASPAAADSESEDDEELD